MRSTYSPRLPTAGRVVPSIPARLHEIKYDGYPRSWPATAIACFTRNGNHWSGRYPWIAQSALRNLHQQFRH